MSRRRSPSLRRRRGTGRLGAAVAFLAVMLCLGGLANVTPIPDALVGLAAVVLALVFAVGAGSGSGRRRH